METPELPDFAEAVLRIVDQIPEGMVLAYGDVAELIGQGCLLYTSDAADE